MPRLDKQSAALELLAIPRDERRVKHVGERYIRGI
jgi:hypothetical protein